RGGAAAELPVVAHASARTIGGAAAELPIVAHASARTIGGLPVGELPVVAGAYRAGAVRGLSARELPVVARADGACAARPAVDVGGAHGLAAACVGRATGPRDV